MFGEGGRLDCVLTLPSKDFQCVEMGYQHGRFHRDTVFLLAEKNLEIARYIRRNWEEHITSDTVHLFARDLFDTEIDHLPMIDAAYIDLTCTVNLKELHWVFHHLRERLQPGSKVIFSQCARNPVLSTTLANLDPAFAIKCRNIMEKLTGEPILQATAISFQLLHTALASIKSCSYVNYKDTSPMSAFEFIIGEPASEGRSTRCLERLTNLAGNYERARNGKIENPFKESQ